MADIQVTWEEAAASVGVPAHGSYNLERALKDSGYVTFEYDFEYLDSGGYRILDKRVKASKGPWFVNGQMEAEDWGVLRPAALEAVAEMRKVRPHPKRASQKVAGHLRVPSPLCEQSWEDTPTSVRR